MDTLRPAAPTATEAAATALGALGHEARLEIYRRLVRAGDDGLPVHEIQQRLGGMPRSTLAHHLQTLVSAGLVVQRRVGAEVVNRAAFPVMRSLIAYLTDECCADVAGCGPGTSCAAEASAGAPSRTAGAGPTAPAGTGGDGPRT